jgi:NAD(P)-dependent dehydrogenase (short-subunit alcohol dehydrogenase family)
VAEGVVLEGVTAIVTGGASGIGVETARALARQGAAVTLAVRDMGAGTRVAADINDELTRVSVFTAKLDLASLASARAFARDWGDQPVHILVNNAGVMSCPFGQTSDGFEQQFGVNHLGHFYLTNLLVPALERGAQQRGSPSRLVVVSSGAHRSAAVDLADPNFKRRPYDAFLSYAQSKSANALFSLAFDRRFAARGVNSNGLQPGIVYTPIMRHWSEEKRQQLEADIAANLYEPPKTPQQGAATSVWAAVAPELDGIGGRYLENCGEAELCPPGQRTGRGYAAHIRDEATADRLWHLSETLVECAVAGRSV